MTCAFYLVTNVAAIPFTGAVFLLITILCVGFNLFYPLFDDSLTVLVLFICSVCIFWLHFVCFVWIWQWSLNHLDSFLSSPCPPALLSLFSRPGPAAPSRSSCLRHGSSLPTPQSSTLPSSPTPWAVRNLSLTGGEQNAFLCIFCVTVFKPSISRYTMYM